MNKIEMLVTVCRNLDVNSRRCV